jgi:hypothetical protein
MAGDTPELDRGVQQNLSHEHSLEGIVKDHYLAFLEALLTREFLVLVLLRAIVGESWRTINNKVYTERDALTTR